MIICGYGNCLNEIQTKQELKITVTESRSGLTTERKSFCCHEHAWRWLQEYEIKISSRQHT